MIIWTKWPNRYLKNIFPKQKLYTFFSTAHELPWKLITYSDIKKVSNGSTEIEITSCILSTTKVKCINNRKTNTPPKQKAYKCTEIEQSTTEWKTIQDRNWNVFYNLMKIKTKYSRLYNTMKAVLRVKFIALRFCI